MCASLRLGPNAPDHHTADLRRTGQGRRIRLGNRHAKIAMPNLNCTTAWMIWATCRRFNPRGGRQPSTDMDVRTSRRLRRRWIGAFELTVVGEHTALKRSAKTALKRSAKPVQLSSHVVSCPLDTTLQETTRFWPRLTPSRVPWSTG